MNKTFQFTVEGLLQAWGVPSAVDVHDCSDHPTKRGIVGLICACLGYKRKDPRIQVIYDSIEFEYQKVDNVLAPVKIRDFQTVRAHSGEKFACADGKYSNENITKEKYYIADSCYVVKITADEDIANVLYEALEDPYWIPYYGRKCCLPSTAINPVWSSDLN